MPGISHGIRQRLAASGDRTVMWYALVTAFFTYFCMYAYRKTFSVGMYEGQFWSGIDLKIILIIAQVAGYMTSKFVGIRIISAMGSRGRALWLMGLIAASEAALLLFAVVPVSMKPMALFLNGLPLGMIWGIVFSYLEGRKFSEVLGAGLCTSFIVSSGAVKTTGKWIMEVFGTTEFWMPFVTGLFFLPFLVLFASLLDLTPAPTSEDMALRRKRVPMTSADRRRMLAALWLGLVFLVGFYVFLTAYRDFRDNFAVELWDSMGYGEAPEILTIAEIPIAIGVLIMLGLTMYIRDNRSAFLSYHAIIVASLALVFIATLLFQKQLLPPAAWMILVGLGLYVAYVPFNSILFDRLLGSFQFPGNAGFLIYIADAFGYLGSVGILLYKHFGQGDMSWLQFFIYASYGLVLYGLLTMVASLIFFRKRFQQYPIIASHDQKLSVH
jgi:hypothetical protein